MLDDLHHILRRYFPERDLTTVKPLSKPTRLGQQELVLGLFGYRLCDDAAREEREGKARRMARLSTQPVYVLREALQYLEKKRIVEPGYTFLQDMVGQVVVGDARRCERKMLPIARTAFPRSGNRLSAPELETQESVVRQAKKMLILAIMSEYS